MLEMYPVDQATAHAFRNAHTRFIAVDHRISFRQHYAGQDAFKVFPWATPVLHNRHGVLEQHADTGLMHGPDHPTRHEGGWCCPGYRYGALEACTCPGGQRERKRRGMPERLAA